MALNAAEGQHSYGDKPSYTEGHFRNFVFDDVEELAATTLGYQENRKGKDSERISDVRQGIASFSEAYLNRIEYGLPKEMVRKIRDKIDVLKDSKPEHTIVLMSAHQPNLFAYSGIMKKIALLKSLENRIGKSRDPSKIICFWGIADHDFVHNKWVRSAEMPAPLRKEGVLRFNIDVAKKDLFLPTNMTEKPTAEKLESWRSQIEGWMSENCSLAMKYAKSYSLKAAEGNILEIARDNFELYWKNVMLAREKAANLAEFSSFLFSTTVNSIFDTPVIFANFSDCFTAFGREFRFLISNSEEYSKVIEENEKVLKKISVDSGLASDVSELLPVWIKCSCGSKYRVSNSQSSPSKFSCKCMNCGKEVEYTKEQLLALLDSSPKLFEPRSISNPIAFSMAFDMSCYIGGKGGLGYLMHTRAVAERLGKPMPPTPYWNSPDDYVGIETLASAWEVKRISDSYKLGTNKDSLESISKSAEAMAAELGGMIAKGTVAKTAVSERERQLLEKIPASLMAPACAIDYAINIGMDSAYRQWVDFLGSDGKLSNTVKLTSIIER